MRGCNGGLEPSQERQPRTRMAAERLAGPSRSGRLLPVRLRRPEDCLFLDLRAGNGLPRSIRQVQILCDDGQILGHLAQGLASHPLFGAVREVAHPLVQQRAGLHPCQDMTAHKKWGTHGRTSQKSNGREVRLPTSTYVVEES